MCKQIKNTFDTYSLLTDLYNYKLKEHLWTGRTFHRSRHTPTLLQQYLEARWRNKFVYKLRFCWIIYSWCIIEISWNLNFNNLKTLETIAVSMESACFVYAIVASLLVLTHESEIHERVWKCSFKGSALFECFPPATLQYPLSVSVLEYCFGMPCLVELFLSWIQALRLHRPFPSEMK